MVGCLGATVARLRWSNNDAVPESAPAPPQYVHLVSNFNQSISVSESVLWDAADSAIMALGTVTLQPDSYDSTCHGFNTDWILHIYIATFK